MCAIAIANPNIAFIKYWGNRDPLLHIPASGSISMNLGGLETRTQVTFDPTLSSDLLILNGRPIVGPALERVSAFLDRVRQMSGVKMFALVQSENNFPVGAGLASSASAFAALSLAASKAAGLELDEPALSRLARLGSGSACRSVPGGFVEWLAGEDDQTSYAFSLASPQHWQLVDYVAIVAQGHKPVTSLEGHALAPTSPLNAARIATAPQRLEVCRQAILQRDFEALVEVMEQDSNLMHAVMMTSVPRLQYWQPATLEVMLAVVEWRATGLPVGYTVDAGANVHVITLAEFADQVTERLGQLGGVQQIRKAIPGGAAKLIADTP